MYCVLQLLAGDTCPKQTPCDKAKATPSPVSKASAVEQLQAIPSKYISRGLQTRHSIRSKGMQSGNVTCHTLQLL